MLSRNCLIGPNEPGYFKTIMKMKIPTLLKTTVATAFFAGAFGWSALADDAIAQTWNLNCAACHGMDGRGQTMMGRKLQVKDLTDATLQASFTDAEATKAIKEGVTAGGQTKMKAFGDKFNDGQIKDLVAHARAFKPGK